MEEVVGSIPTRSIIINDSHHPYLCPGSNLAAAPYIIFRLGFPAIPGWFTLSVRFHWPGDFPAGKASKILRFLRIGELFYNATLTV